MSTTYFVRTEALTSSSNLEAGVAARLYDAAWTLGRQWQIGELLGDDGGSPVAVNLAAEVARLARFQRADGSAAESYDPAEMPLDILCADPVRGHSSWTARLRVDTGRAFMRLLAERGLDQYAATCRDAYRIDPATDGERMSDPAAARLLDVAAGRIPDGQAIYQKLAPVFRVGAPFPATPGVDPLDVDSFRAVGDAWLAWCDETIAEMGASTWQPERLTHAFSVATGAGATATVLDADDYRGGALDWFSFDARPLARRAGFSALPSVETIPTGVRFRGMPNARWWELEDSSVDFGGLDAGPSDIARLALLEFTLVYGNDFFAVPLRVPVGSLCRINSLVVRDTFGMALKIDPAAHGQQRQGDDRWSMFTMSERRPGQTSGAVVSDLFFSPPVARQVMTTTPVEDVRLLRDEMANLAWAVEKCYEGGTGTPLERVEAHTRSLAEQTPATQGAPARYVLGTEVPAHWFPLVPVAGGERRLQVQRMANQDATVVPRGRFITIHGPTILDAEVAREGTRLVRDYALTRWSNGAPLVWARRIRKVGRGEGSSGLRFDVAAQKLA